ncbi:MAG: hypothetical protein HY960_12665 [Ignavibacteriae bacterium]|nr:hypothetical protein [Ignavibacteriota bacterium]
MNINVGRVSTRPADDKNRLHSHALKRKGELKFALHYYQSSSTARIIV